MAVEKSNILDSICFLLGITNLTQVRFNVYFEPPNSWNNVHVIEFVILLGVSVQYTSTHLLVMLVSVMCSLF